MLLVVVSVTVWNVGLNESEILVSGFFNLESLAKLESYCKDGNNNTGVCKENLDTSTGKTCMSKAWYETANCYGSGSENI